MTNHPSRPKAGTGQLLRWNIRDASTGQRVRTPDGDPLVVAAYTAKAAKHRAKALNGGHPVIVTQEREAP